MSKKSYYRLKYRNDEELREFIKDIFNFRVEALSHKANIVVTISVRTIPRSPRLELHLRVPRQELTLIKLKYNLAPVLIPTCKLIV